MMKIRKKKRLMILIPALLLLIAAILIYAVLASGSMEKTLNRYMACIEERNYEEMYSLLDEASQNRIGKEDFITRNRNIYEGIGAKNIQLSIIAEDKKAKTIRYKTVMDSSSGKIRFPNQAEFQKEGGKYRLCWTDRMIHPQLEETGTVRVLTLKGERGSLYDRRGTLLAGKGTVAAVGLIPEKMSEEPEQDLKKMGKLLDMPVSDIKRKLEAKWVKPHLLVPIKKLKKVNEASSSTVELENQELQKQLLKIPGVIIGDEESRVYPLGEKAAHLIGYVQGISAEELKSRKDKGYDQYSVIGKSGLELLYETRLHGTDGEKIVIYNKRGNEIAVLAETPKKDGENIRLTIDARLQSALYDTYREDKSCSAAINPMTGEVLALVSTPSYDSNDFVVGMSEKRWKQLNEDEDAPMFNRFRQAWCPGSTMKPVTGAIGITSGTLSPDQDMGRSGLSWQKDGSWGGYRVTTLHAYGGKADLKNALIYSDNIYFAKAALKIGAEALAGGLKKAGFGEKIPFAVRMNQSQYTNDGKPMATEIQLADSGYGQGEILVNPLHLACIYSAFRNDGSMVRPHIEKKERTAWWKEHVFSSKAAAVIAEGLKEVIRNPEGTGHGAATEGAALAGKTGTAEIKASQSDTSGTELGWFCVYNTKGTAKNSLLLITMAEDVKNRGGSSYLVNRYRSILDNFMPKD